MSQAPLQGDVYVSAPLTNVAVSYFQRAENFIADRVFPTVPVELQGGQFWIYGQDAWTEDAMKKRADGTESAGGGYGLDRGIYFADVEAYHKDIGDQTRANTRTPMGPDRGATNFVTAKALLRREIGFAKSFMQTGVWDSELTGVSAAPSATEFLQWNDANSTPIEDVRAGKRTVLELTGFEPNKLTLGKATYDVLLDHPDIVDRIKYGQTPGSAAKANTQILAQLFEVEEVLVSKAIVKNATEAKTNFIVGNSALLTYSPAEASTEEPSAGYTFAWAGYTGMSDGGFRIKKFRMENLAADRVEIEQAIDQRLVASALGFYFASAVFNPVSA